MKPAERNAWIVTGLAVCLQIGVLLTRGGGAVIAPPQPTPKVTAVVYVYEERDTQLPSGVLAALNTLNRQGIVATAFDADTTSGGQRTPEQYKAPLLAAKEAGLPALVVMCGNAVTRTLKAPTTKEQVLEAIK